jgi:hypothetical protein
MNQKDTGRIVRCRNMPNKSLPSQEGQEERLLAVLEMNASHHWIITLWPSDARF